MEEKFENQIILMQVTRYNMKKYLGEEFYNIHKYSTFDKNNDAYSEKYIIGRNDVYVVSACNKNIKSYFYYSLTYSSNFQHFINESFRKKGFSVTYKKEILIEKNENRLVR